MQCASKGFLVILVLAPLGLWGCAQERNGASTAKVRDLTARNAKLEEDYRSASNATEGLRKKLANADARRAELVQQVEQLQEAVRDREELRKTLTSRTNERDALHSQLVQFSKELQALAGRIEAAANSRVGPANAAVTALAY